MEQLRGQIENASSADDCGELQERLAKLAGGVAVIKVGAASEAEVKEKKARFENALCVTRAAIKEGLVAGGGIALLRASRALEKPALAGDAQVGAAIVMRACEEPLRQLASTAGLEEDGAVRRALINADTRCGLNVVTGEWQDLIAAGIIDFSRVVRSALEIAAAESVSFLSSDAAAFEA